MVYYFVENLYLVCWLKLVVVNYVVYFNVLIKFKDKVVINKVGLIKFNIIILYV